jgi:uncharacterized protein YndB with AHSA1/START domain
MSIEPTGRIETRDGVRRLIIERTLAAPIEEVWAAVTEPARLERWIGTWTGDPDEGRVRFRMTAEGADAPEETVEIRECVPRRRLAVSWQWDLELDLAESDTGTSLVFTQPGIDPVEAESVGPGWEYYLDRLVAVLTGADVSSIDFDGDYYPAMLEHYRSQASGG